MKIILTERQTKIILLAEWKWRNSWLKDYHSWMLNRGPRGKALVDQNYRESVELYDRFVQNAVTKIYDVKSIHNFLVKELTNEDTDNQNDKLIFDGITLDNFRMFFGGYGYIKDIELRAYIFVEEQKNKNNNVFQIYNKIMNALNKPTIQEPEVNKYPTPKVIIHKKSMSYAVLTKLKKSLKGLNIFYQLTVIPKPVPLVTIYKDTVDPEKLKAIKIILNTLDIKAEYKKS